MFELAAVVLMVVFSMCTALMGWLCGVAVEETYEKTASAWATRRAQTQVKSIFDKIDYRL